MKAISTSGLAVFFHEEDEVAAQLVSQACDKSVPLIRGLWGVDVPRNCRVYVMTSWAEFVFRSAPWQWRILLIISMPLWYPRVRQIWKYAGGWAQRYGRVHAVGVKPPRLMQLVDESIGRRIFVGGLSTDDKVQHVTCHELVHAFTAHLKLPMWLNEGLAMVTVDKYYGRPTVRPETIGGLRRPADGTSKRSRHKAGPGRYWRLRSGDKEALAYHYVRGYWLTRYIQATQPQLLAEVLSQRQRNKVLEDGLARAYGMSFAEFWQRIDGIVGSHFEGEDRAG